MSIVEFDTYSYRFQVESKWARKWIKENIGISLEEFSSEYIFDDAENMYRDGIKDNAIVGMESND